MRAGRVFSIFLLSAALAALISARPVFADVNGAILGTVTDNTGAVIAGANVSLMNQGTGLKRQTITEADGTYQFLEVPAAEGYSVVVDAPGFKQSRQTGLKLLVNQKLRANFQLQIGQATQEITVQANAAQVESSSTQLGDVIEDTKMTALPLNGRSYLDLLGLQPGVSPISVNGGEGNVSVNGQREDANGFMVNGGSVEDTSSNSAAVVPVLDSIQEFRVLTNGFDAEYGNFSGALVNVITKSGTNSFHGTAFEFLRNNLLDARNYFDPIGPVGTFRRNQYGGVLGGPIIKNRLFFFGDYQGTREGRAFTTGATGVMSLPERTGNFSDRASQLTGTVPGDSSPGALASVLSARLGYTVNPGEPFYTPGCTAGACVFPGAEIPQKAWSPAAGGTIKFIPNPNAGAATFITNANLSKWSDDRFGVRTDLTTKSTGNWSIYYNFDKQQSSTAGGNPNFNTIGQSQTQQVNFSNTLLLGQNAVNEFRVNGTRNWQPGPTSTNGLGKVSSFGFLEQGQGILPSTPALEGVPMMSFTQGLAMGVSQQWARFSTAIQVSDGFSKIWGRHTLKFGGGFSYSIWNYRLVSWPNGGFTFDGGQTGIDFVDYLLGIPASFTQSSPQALNGRTKSIDLYGQDSVHLSSKLTVNFGLRWEVSEPWSDTAGDLQTFVPGQQSTRFTNSPTGWVFPGDKGIPSTLASTRWNDFAPRLGIAYSPSAPDGWMKNILGGPGKSSLRAGGGIFYTDYDTQGAATEVGDAPFGLFVNGAAHPYFEQPYTDYATGAKKLQPFPYSNPTGGSVSFAPFLPIVFSPGFNPRNKSPHAINYNLIWQRELPRATILTAGYVGTTGRHLFEQTAFNLGNPQLCLQIAALGGGCGPGGEDSIYNVNGQTFNGTRKYSVTSGKYLSQGELDFGDNTFESSDSTSSYNSLQLSLNKSTGDLHFLAAYTYGKGLDYGSRFADLTNPYNKKLSKGLSQFDVHQNFVISYSYDLPFAHLYSSKSGIAPRLLGGWQISGITRLTSGVPITFTDSSFGDDRSLCGCDLYGILGNNAVDLPNYDGTPIKKLNPRTNSYQYFANTYVQGVPTSPFSFAAIGTGGNTRRRFLHGPGLNNTDLALVKTTHVTEHIGFDFRVEFFNVFNHTQFGNPSGDINSGPPNGPSGFGAVTSANDPRIGQGAIKINF